MNRLIRKFELSRSEVIFCGLLLLGFVGYGVYRLDQTIYDANEAELFEEHTRIAAPGEVLSLTHREIGREPQGNGIPWGGTVEMSLQKVALYPSYGDARAIEDAVSNPNGLLADESAPFLVVEVKVSNIDAEEEDYSWYYAETMGVSCSDGAVTLSQLFKLYSEIPFDDNGSYLASAVWCVDGVSSSEYGNSIVVPHGDTVVITLGFSLEGGLEERLDEVSLIYRSIFDRMDIGSPAIGGEPDEALA